MNSEANNVFICSLLNFKLGLTYSKEHNLDFFLALKNRWNEMHECERLFYYNVAVSRFIVTILSKKTAHKRLNSPKRFTNLLSGSMSLILN